MATFLDASFRRGKPYAAYLHLMPEMPTVTRSKKHGHGLVVDFNANDEPVGVEITSPSVTTIEDLNKVLRNIRATQITPDEYRPLAMA